MIPCFFILCNIKYWEIKEEYYNWAYSVVRKLMKTVFYLGHYIRYDIPDVSDGVTKVSIAGSRMDHTLSQRFIE